MDSGEHGIGGIEVHLRDISNGTTTRSTFTDAHGDYSFDGVVPGTYEVEYDLPEYVVYVGSNVHTIAVGDAAPTPMSMSTLGFSGVLGTIDIIASSYLAGNPSTSTMSNGGIEGGSVVFDGAGSQELLYLGEGFEDVLFVEISVNDSHDLALLSIVESDGTVLTAVLTEDQFVSSRDVIHFFGGIDDFDFVEDMGNQDDFSTFRDAIDEFLGN